MPKTKYPIFKCLHRGEKGFTLIELLIVIAILGIIAAVIIPNATRFFGRGTLQAANTEAATVRTAVAAYVADGGTDRAGTIGPGRADTFSPANPDGYTPIHYFEGSVKATYEVDFASDTGCMILADTDSGGWGSGISWNATSCEWKK